MSTIVFRNTEFVITDEVAAHACIQMETMLDDGVFTLADDRGKLASIACAVILTVLGWTPAEVSARMVTDAEGETALKELGAHILMAFETGILERIPRADGDLL